MGEIRPLEMLRSQAQGGCISVCRRAKKKKKSGGGREGVCLSVPLHPPPPPGHPARGRPLRGLEWED